MQRDCWDQGTLFKAKFKLRVLQFLRFGRFVRSWPRRLRRIRLSSGVRSTCFSGYDDDAFILQCKFSDAAFD